jgi:hypothetical protein
MPPTFSKQVYLLKTKGSGNYKIQITGAGMNGSIKVKIATPAETMAEELSYTHNSEYEYTYIDCSSKQAVLVAPKRTPGTCVSEEPNLHGNSYRRTQLNAIKRRLRECCSC